MWTLKSPYSPLPGLSLFVPFRRYAKDSKRVIEDTANSKLEGG
jgi:hypothetical protein